MYGFFKCEDCGATWESAKVFYKNQARGEYYKQQCKRCNSWWQPYRVEETLCSRCNRKASECFCDKKRHTDPRKNHRSDLCEKCQSGKPCF